MLVGAALLTACESDRDSNPTIQEPTTFVLNNPSYAASNVYDLKASKSVELTCTQPDYGYAAVTTYSVQVALTDEWIEATETTPANYQVLPTTFTTAKLDAIAIELDKAIVKLSEWTSEAECPATSMKVWVRLKAHVGTDLYPIHSNAVELTVLPYYIELKDAVPATYYILGGCIGDGKWSNTVAGLGVSMIPMSLQADYEYDKVNGKGEFVYTGYLVAEQGFKIVGKVGSWDEQWGNATVAGIDSPVRNDGGSKDFMVSESAWYTITLNSKDNKLTIGKAKSQENATEYASMQLVGTFGGWDTTPLVLTKTGGEHSHVWYGDVTFAADANTKLADPEGCKFRVDNTWSASWGGVSFPFALAANSNIPYKAGNYTVIFNDLSGCYYFIENVAQ